MKWSVCMESKKDIAPFKKPNSLWLTYLLPSCVGLFFLSMILFSDVQDSSSPQVKYYFLLFFGLFLISVYLIIAYFYQVWVTPKKNLLIQISQQMGEPITYVKSKRVVLDDYKLEVYGINSMQFSKLSQKDLKDIHNECSKLEHNAGRRRR